MATATSHPHTRAYFHSHGALSGIAENVVDTLKLWRRRARERAELGRWEDRDMRDAGISRADVQYEMAKPFWRG